MGKETIINEVKRQAKIMLGAGIAGFLGAGGYGLYNIINGKISSLALLCIVIAIICLVMTGIGIHDLIAPEKSFTIRSNPEIYDMSDEHMSNIIYQDEYIEVSDRMICVKNKPDTVSYRDEVYLVYIEKNKMNFVTIAKMLVIDTARGEHRIDILNADDTTEERIFGIFSQYCPNAVFGYSKENIDYLNSMRQKRNQTNNN